MIGSQRRSILESVQMPNVDLTPSLFRYLWASQIKNIKTGLEAAFQTSSVFMTVSTDSESSGLDV